MVVVKEVEIVVDVGSDADLSPTTPLSRTAEGSG